MAKLKKGKAKKEQSKEAPTNSIPTNNTVATDTKRPKDEIFNNIATPIAAIISLIIFGYIAIQQNELMKTQNQLILSQSLKPYYEKEIEILFSDHRVWVGGEIVDLIEFSARVPIIFEEICASEDYKLDTLNFKNGINLGYTKTRTYFKNLMTLQEYFSNSRSQTFGGNEDSFLRKTEKLISQIKGSNLSIDDKRILLNQMSIYLRNFFGFIFMYDSPITQNSNVVFLRCLLPKFDFARKHIYATSRIEIDLSGIPDEKTLEMIRYSEIDFYKEVEGIKQSLSSPL